MLWIGPFALLGAAFGYLLRVLRRRDASVPPAEPSALERSRAQRLLDDGVGES
ncbi:MAG: hypothetical protein ABWZ88_08725 [Variovorax sp.]